MNQITFDLFSAIPQVIGRSRHVRTRRNELVLNEIRLLKTEFSRATGDGLPKLDQALLRLDPQFPFDPSTQSCVVLAAKAMEEQNPEQAHHWLEQIALLATPMESDMLAGPPDESAAVRVGLQHIKESPNRDVYGRHARIIETHAEDVDPFREGFERALALVGIADPTLRAELGAIVQRTYLFRAQAFMGGSMRPTLGAMFIALPEEDPKWGLVPYFVEHIVHEASHNLLFAMMDCDPLVLNDAEEKFKAPLRIDLRHMYGVYHAAFVISRMIRVFRSLANQGYEEFDPLVKHFEPRLWDGINTIKEHGKLSPAGRHLFGTMIEAAGMKH